MVTLAVTHHTGKHQQLERSGTANHSTHTHQLHQETRGQENIPIPPEVTLDSGFGLTPACEPAVAVVSGAVREKSDHLHLKAGSYSLGRVWPSSLELSGACAAPCSHQAPRQLCGSPRSQEGCASTKGARAEELTPPSSQAASGPTWPKAQRIHRSHCSPSTECPALTRKPGGEGASFSSHVGPMSTGPTTLRAGCWTLLPPSCSQSPLCTALPRLQCPCIPKGTSDSEWRQRQGRKATPGSGSTLQTQTRRGRSHTKHTGPEENYIQLEGRKGQLTPF